MAGILHLNDRRDGGNVFERFDESAKRVLVVTWQFARRRGRSTTSTEDLLAAMAADDTTPAGRCLSALSIGSTKVAAWLPLDSSEARDHLPYSSRCRDLFMAAIELADEPDGLVSELHLLTALISTPECDAYRRLESMGVDVRWLRGLHDADGLVDVMAVERRWRQERLQW